MRTKEINQKQLRLRLITCLYISFEININIERNNLIYTKARETMYECRLHAAKIDLYLFFSFSFFLFSFFELILVKILHINFITYNT